MKNRIKAINLLLAYIKRSISKSHRHSEIDPDCPECKMRILEGYLEWYKDLLKWEEKLKAGFSWIEEN
jgi:hypothetical protein